MNGFFLAPSRLLCARDTRGSRTTRLPRRSQTNAAEISVPSVKLQPVSVNYAKLQFSAFLPELQLRKTPPDQTSFTNPSRTNSPATESDRIGVNRTKSRLKRFFPSSSRQS